MANPLSQEQSTYWSIPNGADRTVPVKCIPQGTLLYSYYGQDPPGVGDSANDYKIRLLLGVLGRTSIISSSFDSHTGKIKLKYSIPQGKLRYLYPSPHASLGVVGRGYNVGIQFITRRDVHVAYVKSGTRIPSSTHIHHTSAPNPPGGSINAFDNRFQICSQVQASASTGSGGDLCFVGTDAGFVSNSIGGVYSIAGIDAIKNNGTNLQMFDSLKSISRCARTSALGVYTEAEAISENAVCLTIETDVRSNNLTYIGFPEIVMTALAERSFDRSNWPPTGAAIPVMGDGKPLYQAAILAGGIVEYTVDKANFNTLYDSYIYPHAWALPVSITTSMGNFTPTDFRSGTVTEPHQRNIATGMIDQVSRNLITYMSQSFVRVRPVYNQRTNMFMSRHYSAGVRTLDIPYQGLVAGYQGSAAAGVLPLNGSDIDISTVAGVGSAIMAKLATISYNIRSRSAWGCVRHLRFQHEGNTIDLPIINGPFQTRSDDEQQITRMFTDLYGSFVGANASIWPIVMQSTPAIWAEFFSGGPIGKWTYFPTPPGSAGLVVGGSKQNGSTRRRRRRGGRMKEAIMSDTVSMADTLPTKPYTVPVVEPSKEDVALKYVAETPPEFAEGIQSLIDDPVLRKTLFSMMYSPTAEDFEREKIVFTGFGSIGAVPK